MMDVTTYLTRIGISETPRADAAWLGRLTQAHLTSIPFENIDVLMGRPIHLDAVHLYDKLVQRRRGGYCFESNGLFQELLTALGFQSRQAMARSWYRSEGEVLAQTHTVLIVTIDGADWLVDVGFGGTGPRIPLPLKEGAYADHDGDILVKWDDEHGWMVSRQMAGEEIPQFSAHPRPAYPADHDLGNWWTSTHPTSPFRLGARISIFTDDGKVTIRDHLLTITREASQEASQLSTATDWSNALNAHFGIDLGEDLEEFFDIVSQLAG